MNGAGSYMSAAGSSMDEMGAHPAPFMEDPAAAMEDPERVMEHPGALMEHPARLMEHPERNGGGPFTLNAPVFTPKTASACAKCDSGKKGAAGLAATQVPPPSATTGVSLRNNSDGLFHVAFQFYWVHCARVRPISLAVVISLAPREFCQSCRRSSRYPPTTQETSFVSSTPASGVCSA